MYGVFWHFKGTGSGLYRKRIYYCRAPHKVWGAFNTREEAQEAYDSE